MPEHCARAAQSDSVIHQVRPGGDLEAAHPQLRGGAQPHRVWACPQATRPSPHESQLTCVYCHPGRSDAYTASRTAATSVDWSLARRRAVLISLNILCRNVHLGSAHCKCFRRSNRNALDAGRRDFTYLSNGFRRADNGTASVANPQRMRCTGGARMRPTDAVTGPSGSNEPLRTTSAQLFCPV